MRAITFAKNGGVEVIDLTPDLPVPEPGPADVVIKVAYAGVNFIDTYFRYVALSPHFLSDLTHTCTVLS
jgi:NADPH2:quinone reductase